MNAQLPKLAGIAVVIATSTAFVAGDTSQNRGLNGTIWAANRATHTIRGFDARSGAVVNTIPMAPNSQPGDLAYAKGKLYVAEEFGTPPALAVLDAGSGDVITRFFFAAGSRPHHVHASSGGNLISVGLYGTDTVAVIDTHQDVLLGPWDSNTLTTNGRVHAGVFSNDEQTLYLTSDASNEIIAMEPWSGHVLWRLAVPGAHELAVTHDGKTAYVSRRTQNHVSTIDLEAHDGYVDVLAVGLPDTLQLSANEKRLTVGLRTSPAQLAVVDTRTFTYEVINLSAPGDAGSTGGHQWTSPSGRYTFASFEGGANPGVAVVDHAAGNAVVQILGYPGRPHGVDWSPY